MKTCLHVYLLLRVSEVCVCVCVRELIVAFLVYFHVMLIQKSAQSTVIHCRLK
jgi:hypothetical protein